MVASATLVTQPLQGHPNKSSLTGISAAVEKQGGAEGRKSLYKMFICVCILGVI